MAPQQLGSRPQEQL